MSGSAPIRLALTVGDPAGIGPEVAAKALAALAEGGAWPEGAPPVEVTVFGPDAPTWARLASVPLPRPASADGGGPVSASRQAEAPSAPPAKAEAPGPEASAAESPESGDSEAPPFPLSVRLEPVEADLSDLEVGRPTAAGGEAAVRYIRAAVAAAKAGRVRGIVTGPISKHALRLAGHPWPGHTEMLAEAFAAPEVAMMFVGGGLRVVLATIHVALAEAVRRLTPERIVRAARLAHAALRRWFGLEAPRIGVCGLNPHAGEAGRFGDEEARIVVPALERLRAEGIRAEGPLPPDTAFYLARRGAVDLVVALYHDQGLIAVKTLAFEEAVNVTLGLPIVRTSVDHGTAFDIAGRGEADPRSLMAAVRLAVRMVAAEGTR